MPKECFRKIPTSADAIVLRGVDVYLRMLTRLPRCLSGRFGPDAVMGIAVPVWRLLAPGRWATAQGVCDRDVCRASMSLSSAHRSFGWHSQGL
jgi:hypothetical protein